MCLLQHECSRALLALVYDMPASKLERKRLSEGLPLQGAC